MASQETRQMAVHILDGKSLSLTELLHHLEEFHDDLGARAKKHLHVRCISDTEAGGWREIAHRYQVNGRVTKVHKTS